MENNINGDDDNESISLNENATNASGFPDQCELNAEINLNGKVKCETKCSIHKNACTNEDYRLH